MRFLLYLYPAGFRAEYGDQMLAIFEQRRRQTSPAGFIALWIGALLDTLANATLVHADILAQDLRYALRTLKQPKGFAITTIVVAALGIGAATAAFIVDHVLIHALSYPNSDSLVKMYEEQTLSGVTQGDLSPANYRDWKRQSTSFESMAAYRTVSLNLVGLSEPQRLDGAAVTSELLSSVLEVQPLFGRTFLPEDDKPASNDGGPLLLSYGLWQREFGGDPSVLGRKVLLDQIPYTVTGVMPQSFYFPNRDAQFWTVQRFAPTDFEDRTDTYIYGIARLKQGIALAQARAEVRGIAAQLERSYPKELAHTSANLLLLKNDMGRQPRLMLWVLLSAAACVLLIASTNLAGLMLARAMKRARELAVRAAMGAGRERLVRQMLTESLILALAGGLAGIGLAIIALPLLARLVPVYLPISEVPPVDARMLLFASFVTLGTGLGFGVLPALRVSRDMRGLRETSRAGGGRRERLRSALVIAEVTGCVTLLVCSGLLMKALWRIQDIDPGFRTANVLTLRTPLPMPKYEKPAAQIQFIDAVISEARQLPGVKEAAYISFLPMVMRGGIWPVEVQGHPLPIAERQTASLRFVTPGLFAALGIPLRAGRDITDADTASTLSVAVVSESFVRRYWPNEDPLGRHINFGNADRIIVGIVGNVRVRGLEQPSEPQVYLAYRQFPRDVSVWYVPKDLVVHTSGSAESLAPALRQIVRKADQDMPVSDVRTLEDIVTAETASRRVQLTALGAFALIAFLLAAIGIHGLLSFSVNSRTQEIGVRMALGATAAQILRMILRDGLILAGIGITLGVITGFAAGTGLQALLAGVHPSDTASFLSAIALCLMMSLAGSLLPARRAVRIDPSVAIRTE
jgi:putative ABC transport system permease protein